MFERVVIGIDPGTAATGVAAMGATRSGPEILFTTTVRTPAGAPEAERLLMLHTAVMAVLDEHQPESVALERLMWGRNVGSAMSVARASGVILLAASIHGLPVHEYAPLEVKMAVTGNGAAAKGDVRRALTRLHRLTDVPTEADAADAVAVAVCHLQQARLVESSAR